MLSQVVRFDVMVRELWKNCGKAGEKNAALWWQGLRYMRKSPGEAKGIKTRGSLDLLG